jgi:Holliday junction DNA helicase RuvA
MIGRLTGKIVARESDGGVVLDVAGVGYELATPLGTIGRAPMDDVGHVTLWVHTHVREDALALYGFADEVERSAFRALLGVSNVGPKIAVAVLGTLPAIELARAIQRRDLVALTAVPGIGKKIAERLLLELRDKLPTAPAAVSVERDASAGVPVRVTGAGERLKTALTGMGFKPVEADRAVAALENRVGVAPLEDVLREALALLAK